MTVGEAKDRMTYTEAMQWSEYFKQKGYASTVAGIIPKLEQGFALLASILINVNGGYKNGNKAKLEDFLPGKSQEQEGSAEDAQALLASLWSKGKNSDKPKKKKWRRR